MRKYGMSQHISKEFLITMVKALDFINPYKIFVRIGLTSMEHFFENSNGMHIAFFNRYHPNFPCKLIVQNIKVGRGDVSMSSTIKEYVTNQFNTIKHLLMRDGSNVVCKPTTCPQFPSIFSRV